MCIAKEEENKRLTISIVILQIRPELHQPNTTTGTKQALLLALQSALTTSPYATPPLTTPQNLKGETRKGPTNN